MKPYQRREMNAVASVLSEGSYVKIHKTYKDYESPDGKFTCWRAIVEIGDAERDGRLKWFRIWNNEDLATTTGTVKVTFYKDRKMHDCIRKA